MDFIGITAYSFSLMTTFIGLLYTFYKQSSAEDEFWLLVAERLGIPVLLIGVIIFLMVKLFSKIYPFIESQIRELIAIPKEQLIAEREERKNQQEAHNDNIEKLIRNNNENMEKLTTGLISLSNKIETQNLLFERILMDERGK